MIPIKSQREGIAVYCWTYCRLRQYSPMGNCRIPHQFIRNPSKDGIRVWSAYRLPPCIKILKLVQMSIPWWCLLTISIFRNFRLIS